MVAFIPALNRGMTLSPGGEGVLFAANMRGFRDDVISEENSEDRKDYRDDDRPGALFM